MWPLLVVAVAIVVTIVVDHGLVRKSLRDPAITILELETKWMAEHISARLRDVQVVSQTQARELSARLSAGEQFDACELYRMLATNLERDQLAYGSCIAFEEDVFKGDTLSETPDLCRTCPQCCSHFAPYVWRGGAPDPPPDCAKANGNSATSFETYSSSNLALFRGDYTYWEVGLWDWFDGIRQDAKAGNFENGRWTRPFDDEGPEDDTEGSGEWMVTFAAPVFTTTEASRTFSGIVTTDVKLSTLLRDVFMSSRGASQAMSSSSIPAHQVSGDAEPWNRFLFAKARVVVITLPRENLPHGEKFQGEKPGTILSYSHSIETDTLYGDVTLFDLAEEPINPNLKRLANRMVNGESGTEILSNFFVPGKRYVSFAPIEGPNGQLWSIAMTASPHALLAAHDRFLRWRGVVVLGLSVVVVLGLGLYCMRGPVATAG